MAEEAAPPSPKLPNMNEFSPGVIGLGIRTLLQRLRTYEGDRQSLVDEIKKLPKIANSPNEKAREGRSVNVLIGMSQCGLFDLGTNQFTDLGRRTADAPTDEEAAAVFASHILHE